MPPTPLSHSDIEQLLATALGIDRYRIEDVFPDRVVYRNSSETPTAYYEATYTISTEGKVTTGVPVKVLRRTTYEPMVMMSVEFSAASPAIADTVPYTGKIFEIGAYPDKGFEITEAEADAAIAAFTPVKNDYEHHKGFLDGKLGEVSRVWRDGVNVFAEMQVPRQVRELAGTTLKSSLAWARDTKRIVGNALTDNPRVTDAQLVAAFTAATNQPNKEKPAMQTWKERLLALFNGGRKPEDLTEEDVKAAFSAGVPPPNDPPKKDGEQKADPPAKPDEKPAGFTAEQALQRRLLTADAEAWFTAELQTGHVFPAQKDALIAAFTQAALADAGDTVCFSATGELREGPMLKALKDTVSAYPKHNLTTEQLQGAEGLVILSTGSNPGDIAPARRAELNQAYGLK